MERRKH